MTRTENTAKYQLILDRGQVSKIAVSEHRTKAEAMKAQADFTRRWRRGLRHEQAGLPRSFTAAIWTDTPRVYKLRYGSSRHTFGWLRVEALP